MLPYFNTSSSLILLRIFRRWLGLHNGNRVRWMYEEGDSFIEESGKEYKAMPGHRFELIRQPKQKRIE